MKFLLNFNKVADSWIGKKMIDFQKSESQSFNK